MKVIVLFGCFAALATDTSGVGIQCRYEILNWGSLGDFYNCVATVTSVENPANFTEINGTHMRGRSNADVKLFYLTNHYILTTIPKGMENFFGNLEGIIWAGGNLTSIDSSTFEPFPNLRAIQLARNKIVTLDDDLFKYTLKLKWIAFDNNLLKSVGNDLLTSLTDLTYAAFDANPCTVLFANNPQAIQKMKIQLPIQCPLLATTPASSTTITTTEPNECPISCTSNQETKKMMEMIVELQKAVKELNSSEED